MLFLFNDTATTVVYTLSLHDALPIFPVDAANLGISGQNPYFILTPGHTLHFVERSEEHTSELQSRRELVCRLLLEKKNCGIVLVSPRPFRPFLSVTITQSPALPKGDS